MNKAVNRLKVLGAHLQPNEAAKILLSGQSYEEVIDFDPKVATKLSYFNKQGWGYDDSQFVLKEKNGKYVTSFTGNKYLYSGHDMPEFFDWAVKNVRMDVNNKRPKQTEMPIDEPKNVSTAFVEELDGSKCYSRRSFDGWERTMHSHGASLREVFALRHGRFERYVDMVVYPGTTEHVVKIVELADKHNIVIVPYGGGTNVTQALWLNKEDETQADRMIVSLDMSRMNKVVWVDKDNNIACVQAGIRGQDLERKLQAQGYVSGHEPDSSEFSTLGGWISTRASGMKKNTYGNIEEIVKGFTFVTPKGVFKKMDHWPRVSSGPDFDQLIMGHEGNLGVVCDAIIRVRPKPEAQEFGSYIFPDMKIGIKFMEEMSKQASYPTSLRLVDNIQFQFGQALKPAEPSKMKRIINEIKKQFVLKVKGFDKDKMCAATCLLEGPRDVVDAQAAKLHEIATKYGGLSGGAENGIKGYQLTYMIAYLRDFAMEYNVIAESFETSCPWSNVQKMCDNVRKDIYTAAEGHGYAREECFVSFRVTQLYETGAAIYVYFSFPFGKRENLADIVDIYEDVENKARDSVFANGGCISHHHGVGKLRKRFMSQMASPLNAQMLRGVKAAVDPGNVFAVNNTIYANEAEKKRDLEH